MENNLSRKPSGEQALLPAGQKGGGGAVLPTDSHVKEKSAYTARILLEAQQMLDGLKPSEGSIDPEAVIDAKDQAILLKTRVSALLGKVAAKQSQSSLASKWKACCAKMCCGCCTAKDNRRSKFPISFSLEYEDTVSETNMKRKSSRLVIVGDFYPINGEVAPDAHFDIKSLMNSADLVIAGIGAPVVNSPARPKKKFSSVSDISTGFLQQTMLNLDMDARRTVFSVAHPNTGKVAREQYLATLQNLRNLGSRVMGTIEGGPAFLKVRLRGGNLGLCSWASSVSFKTILNRLDLVRGELVDAIKIEEQKKNEDLDLLIGYPYWGKEDMVQVDEALKKTAKNLFIRKEFDLLFGHGPATALPLDLVDAEALDEAAVAKGQDPKQALVAYSVGDFLRPLASNPLLRLGVILEVLIADKGVIQYKVHPFLRDINPVTKKLTLVPWNKPNDPKVASVIAARVNHLFRVENDASKDLSPRAKAMRATLSVSSRSLSNSLRRSTVGAGAPKTSAVIADVLVAP